MEAMKIKHKLYKRDKRAYKRARHLTNKKQIVSK